ncbi:acyltransferase family protein [Vibrio sp. TRT 21S02]|uniref:acyltransferase family protein n=1 Tax=Vibrio sp. TRT 21S02 TaxID=3418507 RepID=UPI003CE72438
MSLIKYRPDIDGLRAISVLAVILFHIDASYVPGGFLGVDFFFVISGFLITSIIYKQKKQNQFSYANFYVRRAKRILPALFTVLILTLIAGHFILLPYEHYKLGISVISILAFSSNMQYALRTGDYFSGDSGEWPLLHTWSLAVEEQYYFLFPIILFLIWRFGKQHLILLLSVMMIASFSLAQYMSLQPEYSKISYYLIITRMGEMLVGSIAAIAVVDEKIKPLKSELISGLALISSFILLFLVDKYDTFPGFIALLACVPIVIIILSQGTYVNKLLSNKILVSIGLISFSLYLFHWPILAFIRYIFSPEIKHGHLPINLQVVAFILTVSMSVFSYKLIEKPLRQLEVPKKKVGIYYFLVPSFLLGIFALTLFQTQGMPSRLDTNSALAKYQFNHIDKDMCPSLVNLGCKGGNSASDKKLVLYGNSHAEHYYGFVDQLAKDNDLALSLYASGGCAIDDNSSKCTAVRDAYNKAKQDADIIVIAYRWDGFNEKTAEDLAQLIREAKTVTQKVVVLGQPPLWKSQPSKVYNCNRLGFSCDESIEISSKYPLYNDKVKAVAEENKVIFVDPFEHIKNINQLSYEGKLLYSDDDHLSVYGSQWLYEQFGSINLTSLK